MKKEDKTQLEEDFKAAVSKWDEVVNSGSYHKMTLKEIKALSKLDTKALSVAITKYNSKLVDEQRKSSKEHQARAKAKQRLWPRWMK